MEHSIPQELYDEVFALASAIAQPGNLKDWDEATATNAFETLEALYKHHESNGTSHPFLTETLADFTVDDLEESIRLYRLALGQCNGFPGEPTHTKRLGLAKRLHEAGRTSEAQEQLELARRDAFAAHDTSDAQEMNELAAMLREQA
jgi:hypothetical protein